MRLGCDLDGVLADLHARFVEAARGLHPQLDAERMGSAEVGASPPADERDPAAVVPLTRDQTAEVWRAIEAMDNFWETLDEIEPGAIARLAALAEARRWEVIFLTSRPHSAGDTVQRQSQRWLARLGFALPSVFVVHGSRGKIAAALDLDLVIDDRPENCLDVVTDSPAAAILVWRGSGERVPASALRLGIAVVPDVATALEAVVTAEDGGGRPGFLGRLKGLLGLGGGGRGPWRSSRSSPRTPPEL